MEILHEIIAVGEKIIEQSEKYSYNRIHDTKEVLKCYAYVIE